MPRYGYLPDTAADRAVRPSHRALFGSKRAALPSSARAVPHRPEIGNQMDTETCVGWAIWRCVMTRLMRMFPGVDFADLSKLAPFAWAHLIDGDGIDVDHDDIADALPEEGVRPTAAFEGIRRWGIPFEADWPFSEENARKVPPWDVRQKASTFTVSGRYSIDCAPSERADAVRDAISRGYPVFFPLPVDRKFEDNRGELIEGIGEKTLGGHATVLDAYDGDEFEQPNSWDRSWGKNGVGRISAKLLEDERIDDIIVVTIGVVDQAHLDALSKERSKVREQRRSLGLLADTDSNPPSAPKEES